MKARYQRKFEKQIKKLDPKLQNKVFKTIDIFIDNPYHKSLHNHSLSGNLRGKRAISVSGDLRIIFQEFDSYTLVIFLDLGTLRE